MRRMKKGIPILRSGIILFAALWLLTCIIYPLIVTAAASLAFPWEAGGSLLHDAQGRVTGSALIGQQFSDSGYFWPRPSATDPSPYDPLASGGSNLGPTNQDLERQVTERIAALRAAGVTGDIPSDLVMASASGLDPHISVAAALVQVPRVARARGMDEGALRALVSSSVEGPLAGFVGEYRVNVLRLNLALDQSAARTS